MRKLAILLLFISLLFSAPFALAEKKENPDPEDFGSSGEFHLNLEDENSRTFVSWWKDHSEYLIVPNSFHYNHLQATRKNMLNLLLMVGYKGEFAEVVHAQAVSELKSIVTAPRFLGKIVSGEKKFLRNEIPKGVRQNDLRCFAAIALGEMGKREALPFLKKALDDSSPYLSAFSAVSIGKLGGIGYRNDLIKSFKESPKGRDPHLRSAYLASLAYLGDPMVLPDLIAGLNDKDPRVRLSLVTVFGKMAVQSGPSVVDHYLLSYNNRESVRLASIWALADMGRKIADKQDVSEYTSALHQIENTLIKSIAHENVPSISIHTFLALGYLGTDRARDTLLSCLDSPTENTRVSALSGLAIMGESFDKDFRTKLSTELDLEPHITAIETCRNILASEKPDIYKLLKIIRGLSLSSHNITASGLTLMCARSSAPNRKVLIESMINCPSDDLVKTGIIAAGMVRGSLEVSKSCSTLIGYILSHKLPSKRPSIENAEVQSLEYKVALSYISLGMLGSDRPLAFLLKKMQKSPNYDGIYAAISLSMMGGIPYRAPLLNSIQDSNNSTRIRSACAFSLGLTDSPGVIEALTEIIKKESNIDVRAHATFALAMKSNSSAIPVLYSILTDNRLSRSTDGNYLRGCAALALSQCKPQHYYFIRLKQLMEESDDTNFKSFCALALGLSKNPNSVEAILPLLNHHSYSVRLAACLGIGLSDCKEFLPQINEVMRTSSHNRTRVQASVACGMLGDPQAVESLLKSIDQNNEGNSTVRIASAMGLMLLGTRTPKTLKQLELTASDPDPRVRKYASIARFVLGDARGIKVFVESATSGGLKFRKLDSDTIRFWANQSLPPFFKLRAYLFSDK